MSPMAANYGYDKCLSYQYRSECDNAIVLATRYFFLKKLGS